MGKVYGDLTGQKFGKLTVISRAEDIESKSGKSKYMAWNCKCDCGNEIVVKDSTLKQEVHYVRACNTCLSNSKEANPNYQQKHLSLEDVGKWDELYRYVNDKVMGYKENSLSNKMILRLKGLHDGRYYQNNKFKSRGTYSYDIILTTFKYCIPEITKALNTKKFYTEELKFNYICAIVESKLNDVYMKIENNKKAEEKIEEIDMSIATYIPNNKVEYKAREIEKDEHSDLW